MNDNKVEPGRPDIAAVMAEQMERLRKIRPALMKKAMRGNVWAVGALLKCDKHETKIFEAEEERIAKLNANPANQAPQKHVFSWIDEEVPEWLTPGECAKILGVSPRTVVRLIDQGDLEEFKTKGGHRRIRDCDLEVYMEDLKKFKSEMDNLEKLDKLVSADGPPQEVEALE